MLFRKIPAGGVEWLMGSPDNESGRMTTERGELREKQHRVILANDSVLVFRGGYCNSIGDALRSANRLLWRARSAADAYGFRVS